MMSNTHLGPCAPSGSFSMMSMSLSVQSPAERMWTLKKSSSGAEVMVNGCHSSWEMAGQLRKTYWPTSILKPLFTSCSSSTLDGRMTIWRWRSVNVCITKKKKQKEVKGGQRVRVKRTLLYWTVCRYRIKRRIRSQRYRTIGPITYIQVWESGKTDLGWVLPKRKI